MTNYKCRITKKQKVCTKLVRPYDFGTYRKLCTFSYTFKNSGILYPSQKLVVG